MVGSGRMVERRWIRERALEMDSHHECIGSELDVVLVVRVVSVWREPLRWLGFRSANYLSID